MDYPETSSFASMGIWWHTSKNGNVDACLTRDCLFLGYVVTVQGLFLGRRLWELVSFDHSGFYPWAIVVLVTSTPSLGWSSWWASAR